MFEREWVSLASIQSMISPTEEEYQQNLSLLKTKIPLNRWNQSEFRKEMIKPDLEEAIRSLMRFQRDVEYTVSEAIRIIELKDKHMPSKPTYLLGALLGPPAGIDYPQSRKIKEPKVYDRLVEIGNRITNVLGKETGNIIYELKCSIKNVLVNENMTARNYWIHAHDLFEEAHVDIIEFEEELKFLALILAYPIAKKIELKSLLSLEGFDGVEQKLEEVDINISVKHWRDVISRCRDSVELFCATLRKVKLDEESEKRFANDLTALNKKGVIDEAEQKLINGVYSFLSVKGSPDYDETKVTPYNAEIAVEETYSLLEMLLEINKRKVH
jgi:hypothetical protein